MANFIVWNEDKVNGADSVEAVKATGNYSAFNLPKNQLAELLTFVHNETDVELCFAVDRPDQSGFVIELLDREAYHSATVFINGAPVRGEIAKTAEKAKAKAEKWLESYKAQSQAAELAQVDMADLKRCINDYQKYFRPRLGAEFKTFARGFFAGLGYYPDSAELISLIELVQRG